MQKIIRNILIILLISMLFVGCKKDSDDFGPKVIINNPIENQIFNVFDDILVTGTVKDDTKITSVSISLVDGNYAPVHRTVPVSVSSPSMSINTYYLLDNIHLESGIYYLHITASDGTNDSHTYQKIFLNAVPKVVKQVYITSFSTSSQTNLSFIDSSFSVIIPFHSFAGDFLGSSLSSYYQQANMCGNYTGSLTAIKLEDNSLKYNVPAIISSSPYFTGFYADDQKTYIARYDGYIRGYDYAGNIINGAMANSGYYAQQVCFSDNHIVVEEKNKITGSKILVTYYPNGSGQQQCSLLQDVVAFCSKDDYNVFVFGNISGQATLQLFDRLNNNLWNPYPAALATGSILSAIKIDADTYLFGHSNGTIYKYQYQSSSITSYLTGYTAIKLKYDFINNELYVAESNRISTFDYSTTTMHNSIISAETIVDMNLLYNR